MTAPFRSAIAARRGASLRPALALLVLLVSASAAGEVPGGGMSEGLRDYDAADAEAPAVTAESLRESERFWPYRVQLTEAWTPEPGGGAPLPPGSTGVLIRVEEDGRARIDFGRDGLHAVPIRMTDLVDRAERIRRGELRKTAPNLVHAIGPRLLDPGPEEPRLHPLERTATYRLFLSVYADPRAEGFDALAASLAPLAEREGVLTILFPQGRAPDPDTRERLRALGWEVPFVLGFLAEPYTHSQLGAGHPLPAVQLQTPEGRLLFRSGWGPGVGAQVTEAIDRSDAQGTGPTAKRTP